MRHPFLNGGAGGTFVGNDFAIGERRKEISQPTSCLVLTGPNMGGKSTTLRLSCFAALLAQLGVCMYLSLSQSIFMSLCVAVSDSEVWGGYD